MSDNDKSGYYRGVPWGYRRYCDLFPHSKLKRRFYFIKFNGDYTGEHFATMKEMESWVDEYLANWEKRANRSKEAAHA